MPRPIAHRIDVANAVSAHSPLSLGGFITQTWLPRKRAHVRATTARFLNPESICQLFARVRDRSGLPRIRLHDLRHTHASLLVATGVPIKVVTERLGYAHPAFTMHTYQHLLPGMSADAAKRFAELVGATAR